MQVGLYLSQNGIGDELLLAGKDNLFSETCSFSGPKLFLLPKSTNSAVIQNTGSANVMLDAYIYQSDNYAENKGGKQKKADWGRILIKC